VYLSTAEMHDPCQRSSSSQSCNSSPVDELDEDGVLID
jgi:hypothetical protein